MIYRATGNVRAIQILLGHTKIENTVRYLGVTSRMPCSSRSARRSEIGRGRSAMSDDRFRYRRNRAATAFMGWKASIWRSRLRDMLEPLGSDL